jgi:predicted O-methyltransferase YrrM
MHEIDNLYSNLTDHIEEIDFDFKNQLDTLNQFLPFYQEAPWDFHNDLNNTHLRYRNYLSYYRDSDAIFLFSMMRLQKPSKIIEIGSGFSSALMLDTNDLFFKDRPISFTFIEPNPYDRLHKMISATDRAQCTILEKKIQDVDINIFRELKDGDFLFIDSSHVSKSGSDLNHILFNILPVLQKGVIIHFHDIFFPFEYPYTWVTKEQFYWNECYLIRAYLMNNQHYKIVFFNSAAHYYHKDYLAQHMPNTLTDHIQCGAIWLRKQ